MGAQGSALEKGEKSDGDAPVEGEQSAAVSEVQEGDRDGIADSKLLQKNGQISSIPSLNGHSEDTTLAEEVSAQTDGVSVSQKDEVPETMETVEAPPQLNGEKEEKESPDAEDVTAAEEKPAEEEVPETKTQEVGFKKMFRFGGFKFTLRKDKDKGKTDKEPEAAKEKEGEEEDKGEAGKEDAAIEDEKAEDLEAETELLLAAVTAGEAPTTGTTPEVEVTDAPTLELDGETADGTAKEEEKEEDGEKAEDQLTTPEEAPAGASSPRASHGNAFKKFFSHGIFSNLRKKTSFRRHKEEAPKEVEVEEEIKEGEEKADEDEKVAEEGEAKDEEAVDDEAKEEEPVIVSEDLEASLSVPEVPAVEEVTAEVKAEVEAEVKSEVKDEEPAAPVVADTTEEAKPTEEKAEEPVEAEVLSEPELLSSQERSKVQGSPIKKLFTGTGLKKLSSKKQKAKKEAEAKLVDSGEQVAEQLQSSTEGEGQRSISGPSSAEDSGEHTTGTDGEVLHDTDTDGVTSDGDQKKDGILPWSSFKKLVTPNKRVKRRSESEDENTDAVVLSGEETEDIMTSTEEPKKKMDTSVSWEALMCMGGKNKRTRRTSDSDEDERIEEEKHRVVESPLVSSQETETDTTSPEQCLSGPEGDNITTWESLKRFVGNKKSKSDERESGSEILSDSEMPKDESSFSLRKLIPGRRKKKLDKQMSSDVGSAEEDSDTPAVVPLSEYDNEPTIVIEEMEETLAAPQVSAEDRSPSWISTMVVTEEVHDQLSDIPEEAADAATPKSADTTIIEDIAELSTEVVVVTQEEVPATTATETMSIAEEGSVELPADAIPVVTAQEEVPSVITADVTAVVEEMELSTEVGVTAQEEVPIVSTVEITPEALPATQEAAEEIAPEELMPKPEAAEVVQEEPVEVSETPTESSVTTEDVPMEEASIAVEPEAPAEIVAPEASVIQEDAIKADEEVLDKMSVEDPAQVTQESEAEVSTALVAELPVVWETHDKEAPLALATGLGTTEIATVAIEEPLITVEEIAVVSDTVIAELAIEQSPEKIEEAIVAEIPLLTAQENLVETTTLESPVEVMVDKEAPPAEIASDTKEPEIIIEATVSSIQSETEMIPPPEPVAENTPKVEMVDPIEPTTEAIICNEIIQTTTPAVVEIKCEEIEVEETSVPEVTAPVCEVAQAASREMATVVPDAPQVDQKFEATSSVEESALEETAIVKETVCLMAPLEGSVEVTPEVAVETVPSLEASTEVTPVQQVTETPTEIATPVGEAEVAVPVTEVPVIVEATEKLPEEANVEEANAIEEQGMVIAQVIIQNAIGEVQSAAEETPKPEEPAAEGTEVTAVTTIEGDMPEEKVLIAETCVMNVHVESPAQETPAAETPAPETTVPEVPVSETPAPDTPAPETIVPETPASETPAPETPAPETPAPETPVVEVPAPEAAATVVPEVTIPEVPAPETPAPETPAPETPVVEAPVPETPAPEVAAAEVPAPETPVPETPAPEAAAPDVPAVETPAPVTPAPVTPAPVTPAPETPAPEAQVAETPAPEAAVPVPDVPVEEKVHKAVHEAVEIVTETIAFEVIEQEAPKLPEELKQGVEGSEVVVEEVGILKQSVEVTVSEENVETIEAEVKDIPESQMNGKIEEIPQVEGKVEEEAPVEAAPQEVKEVEVLQAEVKETPVSVPVKVEAPVVEAPAQPEENKEVAAPAVHQAAQCIQEQVVETIAEQQVVGEIVMENVVEFNGTSAVNDTATTTVETTPAPETVVETSKKEESTPVVEEAEKSVTTEVAAPSAVEVASPVETAEPVAAAAVSAAPVAAAPEKTAAAVKCAEVMASVIEVIEEAVKEIEPVSTELTAAS